MRQLFLAFVLMTALCNTTQAQSNYTPPDSTEFTMLIRADDMGMSHGQNLAFQELIESGIPVSVSVMFSTPWWKHAVEILRDHPNVSIGVHLTLNAEWRDYRWGPVLGRSEVPSLVDDEGYFFPSRSLLYGNNPDITEIEAELRAQVQRAIDTGLPIDYIDYHMGAAVQTPETRAIVEAIASDYNLGISRWFDENYSNVTFSAPLGTKTDALINRVNNLSDTTVNLQVMHIAPAQSDMNAMIDLNTFGLPDMAVHRQEELQAILSDEFIEAVRSKRVRLITYRDLIRERGLESMERPEVYRDF
ncbi:MAG: ChbG/HpnK family deacetylase [Balneolales bacterium]|nr:ChbG/HpnK family deacetylase [Balneolales bacterium]